MASPLLHTHHTALLTPWGRAAPRPLQLGRRTPLGPRAQPTGLTAPATACLNSWPAVKRTTHRAAIAAAAPVLGLRPMRARLARTCHVPKRRRITGPPCRSASLIVARIA